MAEDDPNLHPVDLDKLVRRIGLDVALLKWFATHGHRLDTVLSAISLARQGAYEAEWPVFDFLKQHCGGQPQ